MDLYVRIVKVVDGVETVVASEKLEKRGTKLAEPVMAELPAKGKTPALKFMARFSDGFSSGKVGWANKGFSLPAGTVHDQYGARLIGAYLLLDTPGPVAVPATKDAGGGDKRQTDVEVEF